MNGKRAHADYASFRGRRSEAIGLDRRRRWDRIPALMAGQAGVTEELECDAIGDPEWGGVRWHMRPRIEGRSKAPMRRR
jgi:hypothetical protein